MFPRLKINISLNFQLNVSPACPEESPAARRREPVTLGGMCGPFLPLPCEPAFTGERTGGFALKQEKEKPKKQDGDAST